MIQFATFIQFVLKVREDELRPIGIPGLLFVPVKILMRSFFFYGFVKSSRCEARKN